MCLRKNVNKSNRRLFPVQSVTALLLQKRIWSDTCQYTRKSCHAHYVGPIPTSLPALLIFPLEYCHGYCAQDNGEALLMCSVWLEIPSVAQHAEAPGYSQDQGQGTGRFLTLTERETYLLKYSHSLFQMQNEDSKDGDHEEKMEEEGEGEMKD